MAGRSLTLRGTGWGAGTRTSASSSCTGALIAAALGGLFMLAQYYLDLAENVEVLLLIAGIALIAVEFGELLLRARSEAEAASRP